jgi:hypothetical protein
MILFGPHEWPLVPPETASSKARKLALDKARWWAAGDNLRPERQQEIWREVNMLRDIGDALERAGD